MAKYYKFIYKVDGNPAKPDTGLGVHAIATDEKKALEQIEKMWPRSDIRFVESVFNHESDDYKTEPGVFKGKKEKSYNPEEHGFLVSGIEREGRLRPNHKTGSVFLPAGKSTLETIEESLLDAYAGAAA